MSGDREAVRRPTGEPPPAEFFSGAEGGRRARGTLSAGVVLPGLSVGFSGMDPEWHAAFLAWFGAYAHDATASPIPFTLTLEAAGGGPEWYVEPPAPGETVYNPVLVRVDRVPAGGMAVEAVHSDVRVCTYTLAAAFSTRGGRGRAIFASGDLDARERAVENVVRVAFAWLAVARGGLLMHSASIVRDGRAWLFFGASGAGKSTLSALSRRGRVVSDDLTLILPGEGGRPEVVGSPFRGTYTGGAPVLGRFPIAAGFRLRKAAAGATAEVREAAPIRLLGTAIANLPFVVDQLGAHPGPFAQAEKIFGAFPLRELTFTRESDTFWDAIDRSGIGVGS